MALVFWVYRAIMVLGDVEPLVDWVVHGSFPRNYAFQVSGSKRIRLGCRHVVQQDSSVASECLPVVLWNMVFECVLICMVKKIIVFLPKVVKHFFRSGLPSEVLIILRSLTIVHIIELSFSHWDYRLTFPMFWLLHCTLYLPLLNWVSESLSRSLTSAVDRSSSWLLLLGTICVDCFYHSFNAIPVPWRCTLLILLHSWYLIF